MKELRYVVLGSGGIAGAHVHHYSSLQNVKPVGFQDVNPAALDRWKHQFPDAQFDTDPVALLKRTTPDLVSVCSPNSSHRELVLAAFDAGAHVMCEKPMAMNLAEAREMEAARSRADRRGAINFSYRNVAAFRFARQLISSGELGQIHRVNVRYLQSFLGAESTHWAWRNDAKVAGFGALGDLGVHMLDAACFTTGLEPRRLVGIAQTLIPSKLDRDGVSRPVTTDTNASFLAEFENGAVGTFETSQVVPGYGNFHHLEISGTLGVVRICSEENETMQLLAGKELAKWGTWSRENFPRISVPTDFISQQPRSNMESFVRAIRGEQVAYPSFDDGLRTQRCLEAITGSVRAGAWVAV